MPTGVYKRTKEHKEKLKGKIPWNKGKKLSEDHKRKVSENHADLSGKNHPFYGKHHTKESKLKIGNNMPDHLGKKSFWYGKKRFDMLGKNNPNWKGGVTSKRSLDMKTLEYKSWRQQVFEHDDWTCRRCGQRGGDLHAHHLLSWKLFPQYRHSMWNGITLCKNCHEWTHSSKNINKVYVMGAK